jgi:ferrous iron transport protein B
VLYGFAEVAEDGAEIWSNLAVSFTPLSAYSFMLFNLLCAPCFAAIGAIKREMNSAKWTWAAVGYLTGFAYAISLIVYQFGALFAGEGFGAGTVFAAAVLIGLIYLLVRRNKYNEYDGRQTEKKVTLHV